ncbi:MAG: hypothetical protein OET44_16360 [Gammaproteobacteria bacterium]|nr:hypothetical protein [Gammaproteobacteria bacterium]
MPMIAAAKIDRVWQVLLRHAGKQRTPHFLLHDNSLAPLRQALRHLGNLQDGLRTVHIAGSKGKGSTALYLESLLISHGYRVATFTSPHLQHWRERFRICGEPVAERALLDAVHRVQEAVDDGAFVDEPRFFDLLTAIAVTLFAACKPDWTLFETGVGGRFDATNVVRPALCVITRIELEHRDVLGDSIAEIATQKAGIIKPGIPVVCAALMRDAYQVVAREAQDAGAALLCAGRDFEYQSVRKGTAIQRVTYRGQNAVTFDLAATAPALVENAALALAAYENLCLAARADAVSAAFARALPARCELLPGAPAILIDAAHTSASFGALHDALRAIPHRRVHFLVACSSERHLHELVAGLGDTARRVVTTVADPDYTVPPGRLAQVLRHAHPHLEVAACVELAPALGEATRGLGENDLLCVTGSTYLAGRARALLSEQADSALNAAPAVP